MKSRGPNLDCLFTSAPVVSLRCSSTLKEALFVSMEWVQSFSCIGPIVNKIFLCCSICWLYFILFFGILIPLIKRVKWNFNHFLFNSLTCKFSGRILFVMENFICHLTLLISSIFIQLIIVLTNQELLTNLEQFGIGKRKVDNSSFLTPKVIHWWYYYHHYSLINKSDMVAFGRLRVWGTEDATFSSPFWCGSLLCMLWLQFTTNWSTNMGNYIT